MSDLFVTDKLDRAAAWATVRVLMRQVSALGIDKPWDRSMLPPDVLARPLRPLERRERGIDGRWYIWKHRGTEGLPILPPTFDVKRQLMLCHVSDSGSVGNSGMNFSMGYVQQLWCTRFGKHHDDWNSAKAGSKQAGSGVIWKSVVRYSAVQNLPYGPFRSGAWGRLLQDTLCGITETMTNSAPEFVEAVHLQTMMSPERSSWAIDDWWTFFNSLPHATSAPEVLKFARWRSVNSCWRAFRPQAWFVRMLLRKVGDHDELKETTSMWNAEAAAKSSGKDRGESLLQKTKGYIDEAMVDHLDIFCLATGPLERNGNLSLVHFKSPTQGKQRLCWEAAGRCNVLVAELIDQLYNLSELAVIVGTDVTEERFGRNATLIFETVLHTAAEVSERGWPASTQWPGRAAMLLAEDEDGEVVIQRRNMMASEFEHLAAWESQVIEEVLCFTLFSV